MKMKLSATAILSILAVFASGAAVGVFGHKLYSAKTVTAAPAPHKETPEEWRKRFVAEMQTRLQLNTNQLNQLNTILDQTRDEFRAAREDNKNKITQIRLSQVEKVKAMLDDKQRAEYEKMREERERRAREREKQGPPPQ